MRNVSFNINIRCLSIISMHQIEHFFVLSCVDECVYCYTSEAIGKWFVDTLGKIFHVNFLGHARWFMSIGISQIKDHSTSVD